ncbi:MAG: extracellular solute-binding protein [Pirellulales bacterium]
MYVAFAVWRGRTRAATLAVGVLLLCAPIGCGKHVRPKVVVYTSVDKEIALPIFAEFTKATGIRVKPKFGSDLVGGATGGTEALAQEILAERDEVCCDLFWNDEILHTIALDRAGLLKSCAATAESAFPASARSPQSTWYAIASRARVLVVNRNQVFEARLPKSLYDFTDQQWYDRVGLAKPLAGLSATHAACLFQTMDDAKALELYVRFKRNAKILATDREVARAVASGTLAFGLTNSSEAVAEAAAGAPISIVYPDQGANEFGTLFIPMTVAVVKDSPHPEPAEQLLNFLLSAEVARQLADGPSAFIPLRGDVAASDRVKTPDEVRAMQADFNAAAKDWDSTANRLGEEFAAP